MNHGLSAVAFGLAASLSWGTGDFSGGLATRRASVFSIVAAAHAAGLVLLVALAVLWSEPLPSALDMVWGGTAGLVGAVGLASFYRALAVGRMGITAPITAVLAASLPVLFSAFLQGLPGLLQLVGFVLALIAVGLISRPEAAGGRPEGIGLALLAGALDVAGNAFFVLAAHAGRLDVAAILSSLYPAVTVLLASIILRERVTRLQAVGIIFALVAIPLISA